MANNKFILRRPLASLLLVVSALLAGCDAFSSEPTYGGLSTEAFNYTPYNLSEFVITDKYGNRASGGGDLMPGSGEGSLSCCYTLKGTDFTVKWKVYDADEAIKSIDAHQPIQQIEKTTQVHVPPAKLSSTPGRRILGLHFYPDDHVEFEFLDKIRGTRIFYGEVDYWLQKKLGREVHSLDEFDAVAFRRTARIASQGWIKYKFEDTDDLSQYVYFTLLNPQFDEHPEVKKIIAETRGKPGAFGAAMEALPISIVSEIKHMRANAAKNKEASRG